MARQSTKQWVTAEESTRLTSAGVPASLVCYLHACPVCASTQMQAYCRVASLHHNGEYITYERCIRCDLVFRNPRLPDVDRAQKYVDKPLNAQQTDLPAVSQIHYHHMLRYISRLLGSGRTHRLLDFGCGAGGFLIEGREAGFDVTGLEVNRALARHVEHTYRIPVFCGLIDDPAFADEKFDAIVSSQVFEHVNDPTATLQALKPHLKPGGVVLIEVPNLSDIRETLKKGSRMDDSHLFYFNRRSLSTLLKDAGFTVRRVHEGLRPFRLMPRTGRSLPSVAVNCWEAIFSALQIKTALSVIAVLD